MALEGLDSLIKGLEDADSWQVQRQFRLVLQHWPKAVGFAVARKTRPVGIQRGTLYVATATAVWAQTLTYERIKILRKLNRHQHQPLKGIRFSTAQWAQPATPLTARSLTQHPSAIHSSIGSTPGSTPGSAPSSLPAPKTPLEAFERWSATVQKMQQSQAQCPQCRCHCPKGELDRWGICALCITKRWALTTRQ